MKHRIVSYGLLLLLLSCRREEAVQDVPILFRSEAAGVSVASTKAADVPTGEEYLFTDGNTVGLFGTWVSSDGESTDVFSKLPLTCQDNGENASPRYQWDYAPHKYWRAGGVYHFRAVYPYDVNTQFGSDGVRFVTSYSMLIDNFDLMVAGASRNLAENGTSPVELKFHHACAAVRVLFRKGTEDEHRHYYLESFQMTNLRPVGILVYEGDGDSAITLENWSPAEFRSPSLMEWEAASEESRIDVPADYDSFKNVDLGGWRQWHFVIPQQLRGNDGLRPSVRISMHVKQYADDDTTLLYESSGPVTSTIELPLTYRDAQNAEHDVVWEPGKTYTYYVQIQPGEVDVQVVVGDWESYQVYVEDIVF